MLMSGARMFDPAQLIAGAFSLPAVSFFVALVLAAGIGLYTSRASAAARPLTAEPRSVRARYAPERRAIGWAAAGVLVFFFVDYVIRGYILTGADRLHWWRFTTPIACAIIGLGIVLAFIVTRGTTPAEVPVISAERRSWVSFSSRFALISLGLTALILVVTTVAAGLASSPNGQGQYVWLVIPIPNESTIDPIRLPFYGWTYGLPVLTSLGALLAVAWSAFDRIAARPYLHTETLIAERAARRETARNVTRVTTAAVLLTLAGAWRFIANSGSVSHLTVTGQNGDNPYDAAWRYAELAVAAGWCAPILEITGFVLLLLVAGSGLRRRPATRQPSAPTETPATLEATR